MSRSPANPTRHAASPPSDALGRPTRIETTTARRRWDDAALRTKLVLVVVLATVLGTLCGAVMVRTGDRGLGMSLALTGCVGGVLWLAFAWLARPLDQLVALAERLETAPPDLADDRHADPADAATSMHQLPVSRSDELGRLARSMHRVYIAAARQRQENGQLRRTLDHRIADATRQATVRLRHIAMRDALTDLGNRRFFDENFPELFETCRDAADDLACVLLDMDDFKRVNDTLGHAAGDELLVFLAGLIRACIRTEDYAVRLGGDEFVILMPGCPVRRVAEFTEQLRALFRQHVRIALPDTLKADLSIGVAMLSHDPVADPGALLALADGRLYAAKRSGKGRTVGVEASNKA